jgi:hypothetical protein
MPKLYPVVDRLSREEREALGLPSGTDALTNCGIPARNVHAVYIGEKRPPKKGEWYLSGSVVEAYKALNDLSDPYHIARLVRTETKTVTTIVKS